MVLGFTPTVLFPCVQVKIVTSLVNDRLIFEWHLPDDFYLSETHPSFYVTRALGEGSEGSLLKVLQDEGLASALSASSGGGRRGFCNIFLSIELTEKGSTEKGIKRISTLLYAYTR